MMNNSMITGTTGAEVVEAKKAAPKESCKKKAATKKKSATKKKQLQKESY
ncbi:MAG: hypothetical protein R2847_08545 [Bacteroidia bacterium]